MQIQYVHRLKCSTSKILLYNLIYLKRKLAQTCSRYDTKFVNHVKQSVYHREYHSYFFRGNKFIRISKLFQYVFDKSSLREKYVGLETPGSILIFSTLCCISLASSNPDYYIIIYTTSNNPYKCYFIDMHSILTLFFMFRQTIILFTYFTSSIQIVCYTFYFLIRDLSFYFYLLFIVLM